MIPMNSRTLLRGALLVLITPGFSLFGNAQEYSFSDATSGFGEINMTDRTPQVDNTTHPYGGTVVQFDTFSDTLYFDPIGSTLRQVGTVSLQPYTTSFSFHENQANGGNPIPGDVSITLQIASNALSFDTGATPISWDPDNHVFDVPHGITLQGTVNASYSVVTGGQTYTGDFSYDVHYKMAGFTQLDTNGSPASIELSHFLNGNSEFGQQIIEVPLTNGFDMDLHVGGGGDGTSEWDWSSPTEDAFVVPEPGSLAIAALAVPVVLWHRRFRRGIS